MKIKNISCTINLELKTCDLQLLQKENKDNIECYVFGCDDDENLKCEIYVTEIEKVCCVSVKAEIAQTPFRENDYFETESPILINVEFEENVERFCAQYQHRDWWTRPSFGNSFDEIPKRTESLMLKYAEEYGYLLPTMSNKTKNYINGGNGNLIKIRMTAYTGGLSKIEGDALVFGNSNNLYDCIDSVWNYVLEKYEILPREKREYPKMFDYLGWCSWDAFGTDINEEKVKKKIEEFNENKLPIRWILMDDGWQSIKDNRMYSLVPEKEKFPNGFKEMCEYIKGNSLVNQIGVWHTLGGYWGGIEINSTAHKQCTENLYLTKNEKLIPHYEFEKGIGFYDKWYSYLKDEGIDFVKVDGQSALKNHYRNNEEIVKVAKGTHTILEEAVEKYMNGNVINCMGMAIENILSRKKSAVSRNSDDFVPYEPTGFKEHLLQNIFNALYHSKVYHCDWDMYWTNHDDARKHAILRAVSGGPIYISDKIGETIEKELHPLVYSDGRILKMERCALPTIDTIFGLDIENSNIVMTNIVNETGVIAVFNVGDTLNTSKIQASDVMELDGEVFIVYDVLGKKCFEVKKNTEIAVELCKDKFGLYVFVESKSDVTPLGLIDKYICTHALKSVCVKDGRTYVTLEEGGIFGFYSNVEVKEILVNNISKLSDLKFCDGLYLLEIDELGKNVDIIIN